VHIDDVVEANFCVLNHEGANFEAFNVGSSRPTTILEYAELITRKVGKQLRIIIPQQYRVGDNRHSVSSVDRLVKLGWRPERSLPQILDDFLAWVDDVGGIPSHIPDAYQEMCNQGVIQSVC